MIKSIKSNKVNEINRINKIDSIDKINEINKTKNDVLIVFNQQYIYRGTKDKIFYFNCIFTGVLLKTGGLHINLSIYQICCSVLPGKQKESAYQIC